MFTRLIGRRSIVVFCHSGQLVTLSALDSRFPVLLILSTNRFLSSCPHPTYFSFLIFIHHFFVYTLGNISNWALSLFALFGIPTSHSFDILPHIACEFNVSRLYYLTSTPSNVDIETLFKLSYIRQIKEILLCCPSFLQTFHCHTESKLKAGEHSTKIYQKEKKPRFVL